MEIERKFLVEGPLPPLRPAEAIRQGYLSLGADGEEVRLRDRAGRASLTVKRGLGMVRAEHEIEISPSQFEALWSATEGRRLKKQRHQLGLNGRMAEVDVYEGRLNGLVVVEVEFDSVAEAEAFAPPQWFGAEVTDDTRYKNRQLALRADVPK